MLGNLSRIVSRRVVQNRTIFRRKIKPGGDRIEPPLSDQHPADIMPTSTDKPFIFTLNYTIFWWSSNFVPFYAAYYHMVKS